jgi:hypothetical protein
VCFCRRRSQLEHGIAPPDAARWSGPEPPSCSA